MTIHRSVLLLGLAAFAAPTTAQSIVAGPFHNPTNGHRYYVVQAPDWHAAHAQAVSMGGHLATIDNATENAWIRASVSNAAGGPYKLFIGLNDEAEEEAFVWADGSNSPYRSWANGEPGDAPASDYAFVRADDGDWMCVPGDYTPHAVIELSGPIHVPQEFATIEQAVAAGQAMPGPDTILVAPGDYQLVERLEISDELTIRGSGARATAIRGFANNFPVVTQAPLTVEDATFIHGDVSGGYTLFLGYDHPLTFRNCVFEGLLPQRGSGPLVLPHGGSARFDRCTIRNLDAVAVSNPACSVAMLNCAVDEVSLIAYSVWTAVSTLEVSNCVFRRVGDGTQLVGPYWNSRIANSVYSLIDGDPDRNAVQIDFSLLPIELPGGEGNLMGYPQFMDADAGDFRLRPGTIGVDAGSLSHFLAMHPSSLDDAAGELRTVDDPSAPDVGAGRPPIDMGAHETQPVVCPGDFNRDGSLNIFDFLAFQTASGNGC